MNQEEIDTQEISLRHQGFATEPRITEETKEDSQKKPYFIECEDTTSEKSEPYTKVKFNKVVQVVEYSCPTESSNIDTEEEIQSEEVSDSSDELQFNPPPINNINVEIEMEKASSFSGNNPSTLEVINGLKSANPASSTISSSDEKDPKNNCPAGPSSKSSMMTRILMAKKNNALSQGNEENENNNLPEGPVKDLSPLVSRNANNTKIGGSDIKQSSPLSWSLPKPKENISKIRCQPGQYQKKGYLDKILKKGRYKSFLTTSANVSGKKVNQSRNKHNWNSNASVSPLSSFRGNSTCTPLKKASFISDLSKSKNPKRKNRNKNFGLRKSKSTNTLNPEKLTQKYSKEREQLEKRAREIMSQSNRSSSRKKKVKVVSKRNSSRDQPKTKPPTLRSRRVNDSLKSNQTSRNLMSSRTSSFLAKPPVYQSKPLSAKSIKQRALKKRSLDRIRGNINKDYRLSWIKSKSKEDKENTSNLNFNIHQPASLTDECKKRVNDIPETKAAQASQNLHSFTTNEDVKTLLYQNCQEVLQKKADQHTIDDISAIKNSTDLDDESNTQPPIMSVLKVDSSSKEEIESNQSYGCCSVEIVKSTVHYPLDGPPVEVLHFKKENPKSRMYQKFMTTNASKDTASIPTSEGVCFDAAKSDPFLPKKLSFNSCSSVESSPNVQKPLNQPETHKMGQELPPKQPPQNLPKYPLKSPETPKKPLKNPAYSKELILKRISYLKSKTGSTEFQNFP
ncbi:unnamed protein product [Moneuplotes crassus]|uniref:Uncharacterized protein n=1 Tax=Euplotes crassus TaxID=5936 RepID=A0AAD1Y7G5_EUPCR|nr:unnamed protein product [Moneuplotes crassus]